VNNMQIGQKTVHVGPFEKRVERASTDVSNYTNLYVKYFPTEWDEDKINSLFGECGTITSAVVMQDNKGRKSAFVNYENNEGAKKAVDTLHKKDMRSDEDKAKGDPEEPVVVDDHATHLLYVQRAMSKTERSAALKDRFNSSDTPNSRAVGVNLYIKNLEDTMDDEKLKELFEPFGAITSVAVMKDDQQRCKGYGFVCFATPDEATKAVTEMHLKVVKGKPLYVGLAEKRDARLDRLKQRYQTGAGGGMAGMAGGKGAGPMGGPMGGKGMGPQQMYGGAPQMYGMMQGKGMGGMPQMGMGGMPQMGGMGNPMMMGKGNPMMMGGMMGGMAGKGNPMMMQQQQMMMMQQQKGMMGMMGGMPGKGMQPMPAMMGPQGKGMQQMPSMMGGAGKGMPQQQQQQQQQHQQQQAPPQQTNPNAPLTAAALAAAAPGMQKQMLGEKLFPQVARYQPELAGKITGMMLEMDISELLIILESESQMKAKVDEAMRVLETMK